MSHKQTIAGLDIEIFTNISVERIYNIVKDIKNTQMCNWIW